MSAATTYKLMHGQKIGLGQGVLDFEDLGEVVDSAVRTLQSKASLVLQAASGINSNWDTLALVLALGHSLDIFEVTNCPGEKLY